MTTPFARTTLQLGRAAFLAVGLFLAGLAPAFGQAGSLYDLDANLASLSAPIAISTATTTKLIANGGGLNPGGAAQAIHVSAFLLVWAGTGNFQFVYGTTVTTPCDTGQQPLSGNMTGVANQVVPHGAGFGHVIEVPAGKDLCAVTSAAVGINGVLSYRIY